MYDNATRSLWLEEQVWPRVRTSFGITAIPENILVTVGYPSAGARGRSEKIRPAEYSTNWQGNTNEQGMFAIHPVFFKDPEQIVGALAFAATSAQGGARWGPRRAGLTKTPDCRIEFDTEAKSKIDKIIAEMGEPPAGHGIPFPVKTVQRVRNRLYEPENGRKSYCSHLDLKTGGETRQHPQMRMACDGAEFTCACGIRYVQV